MLISSVNDKEVTGPVVAVWLRVLPPTLLVGWEMADVVIPLPLVMPLVPEIVELVLWLPLWVCDGADEVAKLLVLGLCVKVEEPEPMVCDVIDEVIVVRPMLLVLVCPPVTVPVDLDDSGFVLCPPLVVSPVLVVCDVAVIVAVPLWSTVVDWLLIVSLLAIVREELDGS